MRLHRLRKKMSKSNMKNDIETNESALRTLQALGRAVKRVSSHRPSSPRKKRAVISKIAKSSGLLFSARGKPIHQKGNTYPNPKSPDKHMGARTM